MPETVANVAIEVTQEPREVEPGYFLGTVQIGEASHHLEYIRVWPTHDGGWEAFPGDEPTTDTACDNATRLAEAMDACGSGRLETFEMFGFTFIARMFPYED